MQQFLDYLSDGGSMHPAGAGRRFWHASNYVRGPLNYPLVFRQGQAVVLFQRTLTGRWEWEGTYYNPPTGPEVQSDLVRSRWVFMITEDLTFSNIAFG